MDAAKRGGVLGVVPCVENGFSIGTDLDEFFRVKMRENFHDTIGALQADLDTWLHHDNTERPHLGYRSMGRRPIDTVMQFGNPEG